uniref:palmitoyl-CoA hydrolase n=1 Tax=Strigamia maritima TaxID=126957 RepID=T1JNB3_STRMM
MEVNVGLIFYMLKFNLKMSYKHFECFENKNISTIMFYNIFSCIIIIIIIILGIVVVLAYSFSMIRRLVLRRKQQEIPEVEDEVEVCSKKYKPVVCIHGLFDPSSSCDILEAVIRVYHCGTEVKVINLNWGCKSLIDLWNQIEAFKIEVEKIAAENPQGIHLIGLSQGNIIARGILETSAKHNVDTYISVAGPHMGQFGISVFNKIPGFSWLVRSVYKYFYTSKAQHYSVPEFWKDPHHMDLYKKMNTFLPILNNEKSHPRSAEFKKNLLQIKHLVLIGGPNDGIITPWQSTHFGFYDENEKIIPMEEQEIYKEDTLGLKTLDERKAITLITVPHIFHQFFAIDIPFMKQYILPYLT